MVLLLSQLLEYWDYRYLLPGLSLIFFSYICLYILYTKIFLYIFCLSIYVKSYLILNI